MFLQSCHLLIDPFLFHVLLGHVNILGVLEARHESDVVILELNCCSSFRSRSITFLFFLLFTGPCRFNSMIKSRGLIVLWIICRWVNMVCFHTSISYFQVFLNSVGCLFLIFLYISWILSQPWLFKSMLASIAFNALFSGLMPFFSASLGIVVHLSANVTYLAVIINHICCWSLPWFFWVLKLMANKWKVFVIMISKDYSFRVRN